MSRFSLSKLSRCRWNMLDLISLTGRNSVPTYIFADVDASLLERLRLVYQKRGNSIPLAALLIKAISIAQRSHPQSRAFALPFGRSAACEEVVAGFTVERLVDDATNPAVFVGAIAGADTKPLEQISQEMEAYEGAEMESVCLLKQQQELSNLPWLVRHVFLWLGMHSAGIRSKYTLPTFMISSASKFGSKLLIPPSITTSTFGVGSIEPRPVVKNGQIEIRPMLTIALNFDHSVIDGAPAARFLKDVCDLIESKLANYLPGVLDEIEEPVSNLAPA